MPAAPRPGRRRLRGPDGDYRRDYLRAVAKRVEVAEREVRIMVSKSQLLRTLAASQGVAMATGGVPGSVPRWRPKRKPFKSQGGGLVLRSGQAG